MWLKANWMFVIVYELLMHILFEVRSNQSFYGEREREKHTHTHWKFPMCPTTFANLFMLLLDEMAIPSASS